ncbi:unannotated protein [freshwater metagenome]|uniref:Unannotated protein n=1 Tax=freshwater metagenome TaxID=449393 RepID=A0A6J7SE94_9ZZZZ
MWTILESLWGSVELPDTHRCLRNQGSSEEESQKESHQTVETQLSHNLLGVAMKPVSDSLVAANTALVRPSARAGRFLSFEESPEGLREALAGLRLNLWLTRKPEHLLSDDVALNLRGSTPDRFGSRKEERRNHQAHWVRGSTLAA